ncbi:MAG: LPS export ABC transporter periplasmic protein LptC [Bacteroidetes bacterium]|nr:LPS export ABC transporter periplasmic protein LptC [Bacteroidota bacterium]
MSFCTFNKKILNIATTFVGAIFFLMLVSCEEDMAKADANKNKNFPSQIIYNAHIVQRDSGFIKLKATAPIIEKFELIDTPFVVARKGVKIEFFDPKKPKVPGRISAKYAKFTEMKKFYEAKGNVRIITNEGQIFAMQSIYWDQANRLVYTKDTVYVTDKDGSTLVGKNGMKAKDDFSSYTFFNNSGDFNNMKMPSLKGENVKP